MNVKEGFIISFIAIVLIIAAISAGAGLATGNGLFAGAAILCGIVGKILFGSPGNKKTVPGDKAELNKASRDMELKREAVRNFENRVSENIQDLGTEVRDAGKKLDALPGDEERARSIDADLLAELRKPD